METLVKELKEEEEEDRAVDMEEEADGGEDLSLPSVEEVGVRHAAALLQAASEVPLDVARTILAAYHRTLRATRSSGRQRLTGGFIQCPSCSTPWIAGLCKPRLLGCPRNPRAEHGRLRRLLRRARTSPGKLTARERSLLARCRDRENVIEVSCLVCRHKKQEFFPLPVRQKKEEAEEEEEEVERSSSKDMKKRKKKKKFKEVNAGLLLSSTPTPSTVRKKGGKERRAASPTLTMFTSTEMGKNNPGTHTGSLGDPAGTPVAHKNTSAHPRFRSRAKVLLGSGHPRATLPHPSSAATPGTARERQRTVANLRRIMSIEKAKSDVCGAAGKSKTSLSTFLDSLI